MERAKIPNLLFIYQYVPTASIPREAKKIPLIKVSTFDVKR